MTNFPQPPILKLPDLIELKDIQSDTTYSVNDGSILGIVDNATYGRDDDNYRTIVELNDTKHDGGLLRIDGIDYKITVITPKIHQPVTLTELDGTPLKLEGNFYRTDVAFIRAVPVKEGPERFFAAVDDKIGDFSVKSLTTTKLDFHPLGNDVKINLSCNNDVVTCFASGTLIETANGLIAIEAIAVGDLVVTRDYGLQPVVWLGSQRIRAHRLDRTPALSPIRIKAGSLGSNIPATDLIVSPQHRILVRSKIATNLFGAAEVLVAAKQLLVIEGIDIATDLDGVTYHHMLFRDHQIVFANGAETESLFTGPQALDGVGPAARAEILAIFPELADEDFVAVAARPLPHSRFARKLAVRHVQNGRSLVS